MDNEVKLYNLRNQKEIVFYKSFIKRIFSPLAWNWINWSFFPYNPELMRSFLERIGYGSGGIHYFIRPGSGFIAKLFGGAAWGTFSAFDKEFFFSVNNVVWRVPYLSVKNVNIEGGQGLKRFIKQTSVVIDFIYQNKIKKYHVSVPGIGMGLSIPIESKIDTQATENLFKILKEKIR